MWGEKSPHFLTLMDNILSTLQIDNILKKPQELTSRRSSYSPNCAEQVKPILDKLLETHKDVYIDCKATGYSPSTLYVKINDGFKFILDNYNDIEDYVKLRQAVSVRKLDNGVLVYFKRAAKNKMLMKNIEVQYTDSIRWKNDLENWMIKSKEGELWEIKTEPSSNDKTWLGDLMKKYPDSEMEITNDMIKIIK